MFAARLEQEETIKVGFSRESVHKQEVFESKKHVPFGGKRHHTSQSQNYMPSVLCSVWCSVFSV